MAGAPKDNKNAKKWNLSDKQQMFCQEYIIDLNAAQAAIRAGYSKRSAKEQACNLLTKHNIQEYISYLKSRVSQKLEITHEMLTREWAKMAFNSIAHLHNTWMERKSFEEIKEKNPGVLDAIQEIQTQNKVMRGLDGELQEVEFVKIKMYSKQNALENLGKHIGYYEEDNRQKGEPLKDLLKPFKSKKQDG